MNYFFRLKSDINSQLFSKEQLFNDIRDLRASVDSLLFNERGEFVGTIAKIFPITSLTVWPSNFANCIECGCDISELSPNKNKGFCDAHVPEGSHETQHHKRKRSIKEKWPPGYRLNWPPGHKLGNG